LKYAINARISRFFVDKPDWREWTARHDGASLTDLFSAAAITSPTCNKW
jgi:hypothetical protein